MTCGQENYYTDGGADGQMQEVKEAKEVEEVKE